MVIHSDVTMPMSVFRIAKTRAFLVSMTTRGFPVVVHAIGRDEMFGVWRVLP